ncbi:MAG: SRPBCC domain-containing protein [Rhodospirillales bacterium]
MTDHNNPGGKPAEGEFVISRLFDAPRERVFKAWTDAAELKKWWGPKGFKMLVSKVDLRPGGIFLYGMESPTGQSMWGKFVYREIVKPEKLLFVVSFSDEQGGMTRHPLAPGWPLEMLNTVYFQTESDKTRLTLRAEAINCSAAERQTFIEGNESMRGGWGGTMDQLDAYLAKA